MTQEMTPRGGGCGRGPVWSWRSAWSFDDSHRDPAPSRGSRGAPAGRRIDAGGPHWQASRVFYSNGRLSYVTDSSQNRIPDYSYAGYRYGEEPLPVVLLNVTRFEPEQDEVNWILAVEAGRQYTISLYDLDFRGNRSFVYRLSLTPGPRVVAAIPAAGLRRIRVIHSCSTAKASIVWSARGVPGRASVNQISWLS